MLISRPKIGAFRYRPYYGGNRDLPVNAQMSFLLTPVTRLELAARDSMKEPENLAAWREKLIKPQLNDPEFGHLIPHLSIDAQVALLQFVEHVKEPINVMIEGDDEEIIELTDPAVIFLHLCGEVADHVGQFKRNADGEMIPPPCETPEEAAEFGLIFEVQFVLNTTAALKGRDLKNFLSRCGGSSAPTSTATPATPVKENGHDGAPEKSEVSPLEADTSSAAAPSAT